MNNRIMMALVASTALCSAASIASAEPIDLANFRPVVKPASLLIEDEMGIVAKAYQDKVNPAERIYKLAKARGFTGRTA